MVSDVPKICEENHTLKHFRRNPNP
jgi:hypothetical protein